RLYQMLDYYPKGEGSFRHFSNRYGIIGKVWRSGKSQQVGNLLDGLSADATQDEKIARIMQDWGMNRREAERAVERPSYICFLLEHHGTKVGLVYMDSKEKDAFAPSKHALIDDAEDTESDRSPESIMLERIKSSADDQLASKVVRILDDL